MRDDNYEPKRMFGLPLGEDPSARQGEEQRQVMGMPLDWFGPPDPRLRRLGHPVRAFRQWRERRRQT
jgi:hypothetical protein